MNGDFLEPIPFSGDSGPEFLDGLADTLSKHLSFTGHGKLTDNERNAFVWGFRHGVHQLVGIIAGAHDQGPEALDTVNRIIATAIMEWSLGVAVKVYVGTAEDAPAPDVTH